MSCTELRKTVARLMDYSQLGKNCNKGRSMFGIPPQGKPNLLLIVTAIAYTLLTIAYFAGSENIGPHTSGLITLNSVEYISSLFASLLSSGNF
jgi:hypothetical protein